MDLLSLILLLVFVVAPIVNGLLKRGQGGTKGQSTRQRGGTRNAPQNTTQNTTQNTGRPVASTQTSKRADSDTAPNTAFDKRLEEARRRVQEAMDGNRGGTARAPTQTQAQGPARREVGTLFPPLESSPPPMRDARGLESGGRGLESGGQGLEGRTLNSVPLSGTPSSMLSSTGLTDTASALGRLDKAAPLRVQRRGAAKSAKLGRDAPLTLDRQGVLQGLIWHQILSDPPSKHPHRRRSSQHR